MYLKPSRRKKAKLRMMLIIIIAAATAGVFVALYFLGVTPKISLFGSAVHSLDYALPDAVTANENGIIYNQNDTLYLADNLGNEIWSQELELQDATTVASSHLICNYAGKSLQVMKYDKEQLFSTAIDSDIMSAAAGVDNVAVLTGSTTEQGVTNYYISIFNTKGEQTGRQIDFSSRQVMDFGFHGENDMFWALALDTSGVVPVSVITTYKADGSMTGNIQINTQIVEDVFLTDTAIFASGTNALTSYTYFSEKQAEQAIYGWKPAAESITPQAVALAYIPRSTVQDIDTTRVYGTDLSYMHVRLPRNIISLAVTQNKLYAFTSEAVYIYTRDGALEREITLDTAITKVKQVSDTMVILWNQQRSFIMDLS